MDGTVDLLNDRGFGFVTGSDGARYFFHASAVQPPAVFDGLKTGQRVEFEPGSDADGRRRTLSVTV